MSEKYLEATPVVVVEPRHTWSHHVATLTVGIGGTFLFALIAWWLGPLIFGDWYSLGYWQTFALLFFLRAVVPRSGGVRHQSKLRVSRP